MRVDDNTKLLKWQSRHLGPRILQCILRYNNAVPWIYLSPHFDDVALSCGGLVWEQTHMGERVSIWTVCAGEPPAGDFSPFAKELHSRWDVGQNAPAQRRIEDIRSCQRLGATPRYFTIPDCIYRRHPQTNKFMYASEAALNGPLQSGDSQVILTLREEIRQSLPPDAILICPLGLGNHVDHQLTRQMSEGLDRQVWYYPDFPYVLGCKAQMDRMEQEGWINRVFPVSGDGLSAWMDSISAHGSQISTFWVSDLDMRRAIGDYLHSNGGIRLWEKPAE
jgi:LmbE family N-acetylglucosaminyl deacetylase